MCTSTQPRQTDTYFAPVHQHSDCVHMGDLDGSTGFPDVLTTVSVVDTDDNLDDSATVESAVEGTTAEQYALLPTPASSQSTFNSSSSTSSSEKKSGKTATYYNSK